MREDAIFCELRFERKSNIPYSILFFDRENIEKVIVRIGEKKYEFTLDEFEDFLIFLFEKAISSWRRKKQ